MTIKFKHIYILLCAIILVLIYLLNLKVKNKNLVEENIKSFPILNSNLLDYKTNRKIINYFNPNCDHCKYMARCFLKDSLKIKNIQIFMITSADTKDLVNFNNEYKLKLLSNIVFIHDSNYYFQKLLGITTIPSFYIYKNNKLVKKEVGEIEIDNLIKD